MWSNMVVNQVNSRCELRVECVENRHDNKNPYNLTNINITFSRNF